MMIRRVYINRFTRDMTAYLLASSVPVLLNLLINPLIALNMNPEDYAECGYFLSFNSLITPLIQFYFIGYFTKEYYSADEQGRRLIYATVARLLIVFSGVMSLVCFVGLAIYCSGGAFRIFPGLALSVFAIPLAGIYSLNLSELKMRRESGRYMILSMMVTVSTLMLTLLFVVFLKLGAFGKLFAPFFCNFIVFICLVYKNSQRIFVPVPFSNYHKIMRFCLPIVPAAMLEYFSTGYSTTYLEGIGDIREYGIYVVGVSIGGYLMVLSTVVASTFQSNLFKSATERNWKHFVGISLLDVSVITATTGLFILFAPALVDLLTGGKYIASVSYAQITSLGAIGMSIYYKINDLSIIMGHNIFYLVVMAVGSVMIVILIPRITSVYGFLGGAWVNPVSYVGFALMNTALLGLSKLRIR